MSLCLEALVALVLRELGGCHGDWFGHGGDEREGVVAAAAMIKRLLRGFDALFSGARGGWRAASPIKNYVVGTNQRPKRR